MASRNYMPVLKRKGNCWVRVRESAGEGEGIGEVGHVHARLALRWQVGRASLSLCGGIRGRGYSWMSQTSMETQNSGLRIGSGFRRSFTLPSLSSPKIRPGLGTLPIRERAGDAALLVRSLSTQATTGSPPPPKSKPPLALFGILIVSGLVMGYGLVELNIRLQLAKEFLKWNPEWDRTWRPYPSKEKGKSSARQLILIRHGQYLNPSGAKSDDEQGLTDLGKKQAELLGKRLQDLFKDKPVKVILHSNMKRARETAEIVSKFFPSVKMEEDPMIAEGAPCLPDPPSQTWKPSEEELKKDGERINAAFEKYVYSPQASGPEGDSVEIFVCHGNLIRFWFCRALQLNTQAWLRLAIWNTGITWLQVSSSGNVSARALGDVGHLPPDMITYH
uniref:Serine/threonine-protein phosphatase PGAM5, mitochondrial n=1 Tax=Chromera velia CCMP2878 TaxID=1169474 RepID=A0A0G4HBS8_9ALVE|eukprot:Cvel_6187.t1-p1 / transcript=Cvel_6187.t1 / gene=Cvel_6187 / organism=Chromera_velia_CCMP2878 / gene_product=Serine/threonine-protein phosphatase PGAM5,, putative / transcript_product=Serine/threonine-protein phosphatase PGAM5,, putative / location=Cvel_scaffold299:79331-86501(+) / protein_length=389 / sequence_SO=supercontig / SO=protein_coding / is_pseudo=false